MIIPVGYMPVKKIHNGKLKDSVEELTEKETLLFKNLPPPAISAFYLRGEPRSQRNPLLLGATLGFA